MKLLDYIYYCSYRFFLRTPLRSGADAWPSVFLAISTFVNALTIYFLLTVVTGIDGIDRIPHDVGRLLSVILMFFFAALLCWHYVWRENAGRVISSFEKRGNRGKYAVIGAIMVAETLCLPFTLMLVLICSQRLTGWPPHP
jgi:hypothetical protein